MTQKRTKTSTSAIDHKPKELVGSDVDKYGVPLRGIERWLESTVQSGLKDDVWAVTFKMRGGRGPRVYSFTATRDLRESERPAHEVPDVHRPCKQQQTLLVAELERLRAEYRAACERDELCAEVKRLRAENAANERRARAFQAGATKLQGERDTANALLERWERKRLDEDGNQLRNETARHLAGQTAAPESVVTLAGGTYSAQELRGIIGFHEGQRTAAEQRVLELVAAWFDSWPIGGPEEDSGLEEERALYCAELARREGK